MRKSFEEVLAEQKQLSKVTATKRPASSKNGIRDLRSESIEAYIPSADAHTESIISSRLRRR